MNKVLVNETSLTAIADAIREKNGETTTYKPSEMSSAILSITTGTGVDLPEEAFGQNSQGNDYKFYNGNWYWFMEQFADQLEPQEIAPYICANNTTIETFPISFVLINGDCDFAFYNCKQLTELNIEPATSFYYYYNTRCMFHSCQRLRTLPNNLFGENVDSGGTVSCRRDLMFGDCYSLRNLPDLTGLGGGRNFDSANIYNLYHQLAQNCYALDAIENLPVIQMTSTSTYGGSAMLNMVSQCNRLKELTFAVNEDGTPKTANWTAHTINLSNYVGWSDGDNGHITDYNSGITASTKVDDDNDYANYKDNDDWWTGDYRYSRYNKTSAINTINSLPDCSAYGTNTITFKGEAGKYTDGGAINTLSETEIAVATSRGWTVAFTDVAE